MTADEQKKDDIQTMRILFNADIEELCNQHRFKDAQKMEDIRDRLIKALEQSTGFWITVRGGKSYECSICHNEGSLYSSYKAKFCPTCGAKMESEDV